MGGAARGWAVVPLQPKGGSEAQGGETHIQKAAQGSWHTCALLPRLLPPCAPQGGQALTMPVPREQSAPLTQEFTSPSPLVTPGDPGQDSSSPPATTCPQHWTGLGPFLTDSEGREHSPALSSFLSPRLIRGYFFKES